MPEPLNITVYGRPGCHLCEAVTDTLDDLRREFAFNVTTIDITADTTLFAQLWSQIPVVEIAGHQLRAPINSARLAATIARAVRGNTLDDQ